MADQPGELRRINWDECFPFTRLFKTFRMAIQPAKLGLALAGVILMGIWGGLLDLVWPNSLEPVGPEVSLYWQVADVGTWRDAQKAQRLAAVQDVYGPAGLLQGKGPGGLEELRSSKAVGQALAKLKAEYADAVTQAQGDESKIAALAQRYRAEHARLAAFKTRGIFSSFLRYEQQVVLNLLDQARSVLMLDFEAVTRGTEAVVRGRRGGAEEQRADGFGHIGIIGSVLMMYRGVQWMIAEHFLFAVLFLLG
ncbi:MAG: hypothetical protein HY718_15090, partial [Planctomycetes bacterium]|nr:hypothetical protein [Planctomycetota bacterium]